MESEGGAGGITYRYVYGIEKVEVAIFGIPNGAGSVTPYAYDGGNGGWSSPPRTRAITWPSAAWSSSGTTRTASAARTT